MRQLSISILAGALIAGTVMGQDWAKGRLEKSPRHLEWVKVKHGDRVVNCFIAYPQVKDPATAVLVIHDSLGVTDWLRGVTDQLAEAGYLAIAPDLLSGAAPGAGGTSELGGPDSVRKAIDSLPSEPDYCGFKGGKGLRGKTAHLQRQGGSGRFRLGRQPELPLRHER